MIYNLNNMFPIHYNFPRLCKHLTILSFLCFSIFELVIVLCSLFTWEGWTFPRNIVYEIAGRQNTYLTNILHLMYSPEGNS